MALMMDRTRIILVLTLLLTLGWNSDAQIRIIPREKVEAVSNPRLSRDSSALDFQNIHIVADMMNEDDPPATYRYRYRNVSDRRLQISRLVTTCSCASAKADKMSVGPGEDAEIVVRYDPKGHPGKFQRKIFVYTGDKDPAAVLLLSVDVRNGGDLAGEWPVQMGKIRLRRSEVTFSEGRKSVEKLRFINLAGRPLKLECDAAFLPECLEFRTKPEIVDDGKEGEIVLMYDPAKSGARGIMKVMIRDLGVPPSKSTITVFLSDDDL